MLACFPITDPSIAHRTSHIYTHGRITAKSGVNCWKNTMAVYFSIVDVCCCCFGLAEMGKNGYLTYRRRTNTTGHTHQKLKRQSWQYDEDDISNRIWYEFVKTFLVTYVPLVCVCVVCMCLWLLFGKILPTRPKNSLRSNKTRKFILSK